MSGRNGRNLLTENDKMTKHKQITTTLLFSINAFWTSCPMSTGSSIASFDMVICPTQHTQMQSDKKMWNTSSLFTLKQCYSQRGKHVIMQTNNFLASLNPQRIS